jgi:hypothetical protein
MDLARGVEAHNAYHSSRPQGTVQRIGIGLNQARELLGRLGPIGEVVGETQLSERGQQVHDRGVMGVFYQRDLRGQKAVGHA